MKGVYKMEEEKIQNIEEKEIKESNEAKEKTPKIFSKKAYIAIGITALAVIIFSIVLIIALGNNGGQYITCDSCKSEILEDTQFCPNCGYQITDAPSNGNNANSNTNDTISSKTLSLEDGVLNGRVDNNTEVFDFMQDITVPNSYIWVVSLDIYGMQNIATKTAPLSEGNNTFYIHITDDKQNVSTYTVNIYRNHIYTVTFNTNGGTDIEPIYVEEGALVSAPITTRVGYNFGSWDYNFETPISSNITINATWNPKGDTQYKIKYYFENLDKSGYELKETINLTGMKNENVNAEQPLYEHFTINTYKSILSGNIKDDGSLILKVYYDRNVYNLTLFIEGKPVSNPDVVPDGDRVASIALPGMGGDLFGDGDYPYGTEVTISVIEWLAYTFDGWFIEGVPLSTSKEYTFTIEKNTTIEAKFIFDEALNNFAYLYDRDGITILDVIDKTVTEIVIPDYITRIVPSAFSGCSNLTTLTLGKNLSSLTDSPYTDNPNTRIVGGFTCGSDDALILNGCNKLQSILVSSENQTYASIDGNLYSKDGKFLIAYAPGKTETSFLIPDSVTYISISAFYNCNNLTDIYLTRSKDDYLHSIFQSYEDKINIHYNYIRED